MLAPTPNQQKEKFMENLNVKIIENDFTVNDVMSGMLASVFEQWTYQFADNNAENYNGGSWAIKKLSNGGFFYLLNSDSPIKANSFNGWSGEMSPLLFSVVLSMTVSSNLSIEFYKERTKGKNYRDFPKDAKLAFNKDGEQISDNYHLLRSFLYQDDSIFTSEEISDAINFLD